MFRKEIPGLTFQSDSHTYLFNGTRVPSVTSILGPALGGGDYINDAMRAGMARGTAVHLATQYMDENRLDLKSVDPSLRPFLSAYSSFILDVNPEILAIEQMVYHTAYQYAGTCDRVVRIGNMTGVLDIKTGSAPFYTGAQTAAYYEALRTQFDGMNNARWHLILKNDGTYRLNAHTNGMDFDVFRSALFIYKYKETSR